MKLSLRPIKGLLPTAEKLPFAYAQIGGTKGDFPKGYNHDYNEVCIGSGSDLYHSAIEELKNWRHYPPDWTRVESREPGIKPDKTVAVNFKLFGIWFSNYCRIVYLEKSDLEWGFAYGTLTEHVEKGEEYFYVRTDKQRMVYYGIKAFSKPQKWFVWLGYPIARYYQKKFVLNSLSLMKKFGDAYEK